MSSPLSCISTTIQVGILCFVVLGSLLTTKGANVTWPVRAPVLNQQYGERDSLDESHGISNLYKSGRNNHTGLDLGSTESDEVLAFAKGTVVAIVPNIPSSELGNTLILRHDELGGVFSVYGHLAAPPHDADFDPLTHGDEVAMGSVIGIMGGTAKGGSPWPKHLHFEVKDHSATSDSSGDYTGYTPGHPNHYGYRDPREFLAPFSSTEIDPVALRNDSGADITARNSPGTSYDGSRNLGLNLSSPASTRTLWVLKPNQSACAIRKAVIASETWYFVDLPSRNEGYSGTSAVHGPTGAWVRASEVTQISPSQGTLFTISPGAGAIVYESANISSSPAGKAFPGQTFFALPSAPENGWISIDIPSLGPRRYPSAGYRPETTGWIRSDDLVQLYASCRFVAPETGIPISNAPISIDGVQAGVTDAFGWLRIQANYWGSRVIEAFRLPVAEAATVEISPERFLSNSIVELTPTATPESSTRFRVGDSVYVGNTGVGLRGRYPNSTSSTFNVLPDSSSGTVVGGPDNRDGYNRWRIRFQGYGYDMWCAEGQPFANDYYLFTHRVGAAPGPPTSFTATAVSQSQINLRWAETSTNESGFRIERRLLPEGFWNSIATKGSNSTTHSDTGLPTSTSYEYRVAAYNSYGTSGYSNVAIAGTSVASTSTQTLTVNSVDLASLQTLAVQMSSYEGISTGFRWNTTRFTRSAAANTEITVSAPATLVNGRIFQYWMRDLIAFDYSLHTKVRMDGPHELIAIYSDQPPPNRTLQSISIQGPSSIDERRAATYSARATYTDGTTGTVPASWSEQSSYASISASGVLDTASVSSDKSVTVSASATVSGVTKTDTKSVTIRNTDIKPTYTLDLNAVNGHISASPDLRSYEEGTEVRLTAYPDDNYVRSHWSGDASGTERTVYITMSRDKSVTAHFILDTRTADITVNIEPPAAAAAGAAFKIGGEGSFLNDWQPPGDTIYNRKAGIHRVWFKTIPGWVTPDDITIEVAGGLPVLTTGIYQEVPGAVQIILSPDEAATAVARWRLDGGAWQESGATLQNVSPGTRNIEYFPVPGWTAPSATTITIDRGAVASQTSNYTPPVGQPVITSVAPRTGPISGGTEVTITGINFQPGATVSFGGIASTSVILDSGSRIRAWTPARSSYGTVSVVVTSGGNAATKANGFSYLEPLGSNMELVGQLGGSFLSVAAEGNFAYAGEGTGFVIMDVTNPSSPVERGRIALPDLVYGIAVASGKAYVATGNSGLYVLDVATPATPAIVGFYDTPGTATGIAVDGSRAYLADGSAGLQVIDVSTPAAPTLISTFDTPGSAVRLVVATVGSRRIVFIADGLGGVRVVEVTVPSAPVEISTLPTTDVILGMRDVKCVGNRLYAVGGGTGFQAFDVSNPNQPQLLGSSPSINALTFDVAGTNIFLAGTHLIVLDASNPANLSTTSYTDVGSSPSQVKLLAGNLYIAEDKYGFKVVSVANPASPFIRATVKGIGRVIGLTARDSTVLTGSDSEGMDIVNVANPAVPVAQSHFGNDRVSHLAVNGNTAVLVNFGEEMVNIVDISQPASPVQKSTYTVINGWDVAFQGGHLVLAGTTRTSSAKPLVDVINVSNPASPVRSGMLQVSAEAGTTSSIAFAGTWGYLTRPNRSLDILDFSSPSNPVLVGSVPMTGYIMASATSGDGSYVYVADDTNGIQVVNATVKSAPVVVATIDPSQSSFTGVNGVRVSGDRLFVTDRSWAYVYDISQPASPLLVAYYDMPKVSTYGSKLEVAGDLVYIAGGDAGLVILKVKDIEKPTITIGSPTPNVHYQTGESTAGIGGSASDNSGVTRVTWQNERGGGGTAMGTNSWSIPNVLLAPGLNRITVTAEDAESNIGSDVIEITATFPDLIPPVVIITGPRSEPEMVTETSPITLAGAATDDRQVAGVTWADQFGNSGIAVVNTGTWSIESVPLVEGPNILTITAADGAGNVASDQITILLASPDLSPPSVTIGFPSTEANFPTRSATINLSGESTDDGQLSALTWSNSRGGAATTEGTSTWAANGIELQPGINFITVTAIDSSGKTGEDTLSVTYTPYDSDADGLADDWEMQHFSALNVAGLETDTGNTSYSDFLKQALGLDPGNHDPEALPRVVTGGQAGVVGPVFKYRRPIAPGPLHYTIGVSEDLGVWDWSESQIEQVGVPTPTGDGFTEEVTLRLIATPGGPRGSGFFKINVTAAE